MQTHGQRTDETLTEVLSLSEDLQNSNPFHFRQTDLGKPLKFFGTNDLLRPFKVRRGLIFLVTQSHTSHSFLHIQTQCRISQLINNTINFHQGLTIDKLAFQHLYQFTAVLVCCFLFLHIQVESTGLRYDSKIFIQLFSCVCFQAAGFFIRMHSVQSVAFHFSPHSCICSPQQKVSLQRTQEPVIHPC